MKDKGLKRSHHKKKSRCQVNGCENDAKFALFKITPNAEKIWLHVCDKHEIEIGNENMKRAEKEFDNGIRTAFII